MHTVDALEAALALAKQVGYRVREEWLDGRGGGGCEIRGQKWIFLDLALGPEEQLDQVLESLRNDPTATENAGWARLRAMGMPKIGETSLPEQGPLAAAPHR
ncbi:MAG TPA: hypothetical protein DD670_06960 [Planctomycetaceae bacterium]|nr:hypothetical protein [Planctomycetaceae bacterium]